MLPVSLECPFLIVPSVFSNVYLKHDYGLKHTPYSFVDIEYSKIGVWVTPPYMKSLFTWNALIFFRAEGCFIVKDII